MRAFMDILPLVPNLTHLRLPFRCAPFRLEELCLAPFAKNLKALELVDVEYGAILDDKGRDVNVLLLRHLPNLEVLSLNGPGDANGGTGWELRKQAPLKLDKLHTLILNGVKTGIVLDTLIDSELPALRRLILTSFHQRENDLTLAFQETHGHKILSLAYLPICKPSLESHPPNETLDLHPNLIHLSYLIHDKPSHANVRLASTPFRSLPRSIRSLTLPKWNVAGTASPAIILDPENQETAHFTWAPPMTNDIPSRLLNMFLNDPLPDLKVINIDGFRWVRPELGARALMTGDSGAMRVWSDKFSEPGIEMRDMDGRTAPVLEFPMVEQVRGRRRPSVRAEHAVRADELDDDGG